MPFNSRYLGFSVAPAGSSEDVDEGDKLSIPVTWDFPLHRMIMRLLVGVR